LIFILPFRFSDSSLYILQQNPIYNPPKIEEAQSSLKNGEKSRKLKRIALKYYKRKIWQLYSFKICKTEKIEKGLFVVLLLLFHNSFLG